MRTNWLPKQEPTTYRNQCQISKPKRQIVVNDIKKWSLRGAKRRGNPVRLFHFALNTMRCRASFAMTRRGCQLIYGVHYNQSIIVWTLKTKFPLPSPAYGQALNLTWYRAGRLYKREEFPLFGILFLSLIRQRGVREDFYNIRRGVSK